LKEYIFISVIHPDAQILKRVFLNHLLIVCERHAMDAIGKVTVLVSDGFVLFNPFQ